MELAWVLVSTIAKLIKMAKKSKTINLTRHAFFEAKRATLPDNSDATHPDHPLSMLPTTDKDVGDAKYTLQGIITAP